MFEEKKLINVLNNYIEHDLQERPSSQSVGKFYPSSVGKCKRAIVYQMLGYPKQKQNLRTYSILDNGNYFHDRMEKLFKEAGILIASELPFKDAELHLSGRLDLIVKNPMQRELEVPIILLDASEEILFEGFSEELAIVELKSISDKGFMRLNDAKEEHKDQLTLYMYNKRIFDGFLFYENKNTQELAEFYVPYDEDRAERVIQKIKSCVGSYESKTLPEKEFFRNDFECQYCDFREICYPSEHKYNLASVL